MGFITTWFQCGVSGDAPPLPRLQRPFCFVPPLFPSLGACVPFRFFGPPLLEPYLRYFSHSRLAVVDAIRNWPHGFFVHRPSHANNAQASLPCHSLISLVWQTFTPPSIMRVSKSDWSYGKILRGMKREAKILKIVAGVAIGAVAVAARFFFRR